MKISLKQGLYYRNRTGDVRHITKEISPEELCFKEGFRFRDHNGESYKPDGSWSFVKKKTDKDLIECVVNS